MPESRGEQAAERARLALARAQQLATRLTELRDRGAPSPASIEQAVRSANEALDHASLALRQAAEAHHRAAEVHRRVADLMDQLGQTERAEEHRRLAQLDEDEGIADDAAAGVPADGVERDQADHES
jgi:hypothetical protein